MGVFGLSLSFCQMYSLFIMAYLLEGGGDCPSYHLFKCCIGLVSLALRCSHKKSLYIVYLSLSCKLGVYLTCRSHFKDFYFNVAIPVSTTETPDVLIF